MNNMDGFQKTFVLVAASIAIMIYMIVFTIKFYENKKLEAGLQECVKVLPGRQEPITYWEKNCE